MLASVACWKLRKGPRVTGVGAGAGAGYVFSPGNPGAPGNITQAPQYVLYNPAAPPVFVPYYPQPQQPMESPRPAYDPAGIRYTSPPPPQQYSMDTRYQSPPPEGGQSPQQYPMEMRYQSPPPEGGRSPQQYPMDTGYQSPPPEGGQSPQQYPMDTRYQSPPPPSTYQYPSRTQQQP